ncbi:hypothetical protein CEXT_370231 [Caerostris extrusa]|uniref:Uncharacterized protein n=1 Tax=Caerostris extrusa TaxID=172846 RepID=A0AAV4NHA9_CAEEX|nr:hypothetical protein CEXT_370231 [Caerostris extrusa]
MSKAEAIIQIKSRSHNSNQKQKHNFNATNEKATQKYRFGGGERECKKGDGRRDVRICNRTARTSRFYREIGDQLQVISPSVGHTIVPNRWKGGGVPISNVIFRSNSVVCVGTTDVLRELQKEDIHAVGILVCRDVLFLEKRLVVEN